MTEEELYKAYRNMPVIDEDEEVAYAESQEPIEEEEKDAPS